HARSAPGAAGTARETRTFQRGAPAPAILRTIAADDYRSESRRPLDPDRRPRRNGGACVRRGGAVAGPGHVAPEHDRTDRLRRTPGQCAAGAVFDAFGLRELF